MHATHQVEVLGEAEEPDSRVLDGLLETLPRRALLVRVDSVSEQSLVGECSLFRREPSGGEGRVGQEREGENRH